MKRRNRISSALIIAAFGLIATVPALAVNSWCPTNCPTTPGGSASVPVDCGEFACCNAAGACMTCSLPWWAKVLVCGL